MLKRICESRGGAILLKPFFRTLDLFWRKDDGLVVFSGGRHTSFSDNSRFLFEKSIEEFSRDYSIVWVTPNKDLLENSSIPERLRKRMIYQYSIDGITTLLRAKVIFFSWAFSDLPGTSYSIRTTTIQLWHGIPIKRICNFSKTANRKDMTSQIQQWNKFTYWICSSSTERDSISLCTGLPIDRVKITGYPRNDYLLERADAPNPCLLESYPFMNKKTILYAPTWRMHSRVRFFPFDDFQIDRLVAFLEENDAYLILRAHHADDILARNGIVDYDPLNGNRVFVLNRRQLMDVQELLPYVDVMVSDYSGIWVDYLLLDRPIIFVPYDRDEYEEKEGLLYDYDTITPGPKVSSFGELLYAMSGYLSEPTKDSERRKEIRKMFHKYDDGEAHKRIFGLLSEKGE